MDSTDNLEDDSEGRNLSMAYSSEVLTLGFTIMKEIIQVANLTESGVERTAVPIQILCGTECLILDEVVDVRLSYFSFLFAFLSLETSDVAHDISSLHSSLLKHDFIARLHVSLFEYATQFCHSAKDFVLLNIMLNVMIVKLGTEAMLCGVPMILKLQSIIIDKIHKLDAKKSLVLDTICMVYLEVSSSKLELHSLNGVVTREIGLRRKRGLWTNNIRELPEKLPHSLDELITHIYQEPKPEDLLTNENKDTMEETDVHDNDLLFFDQNTVKEFINGSREKELTEALTAPWIKENVSHGKTIKFYTRFKLMSYIPI